MHFPVPFGVWSNRSPFPPTKIPYEARPIRSLGAVTSRAAGVPDRSPGGPERTVCSSPTRRRRRAAWRPARRCCLFPWCCWPVCTARTCWSGKARPWAGGWCSCSGRCGCSGRSSPSRWSSGTGSGGRAGLAGTAAPCPAGRLKHNWVRGRTGSSGPRSKSGLRSRFRDWVLYRGKRVWWEVPAWNPVPTIPNVNARDKILFTYHIFILRASEECDFVFEVPDCSL